MFDTQSYFSKEGVNDQYKQVGLDPNGNNEIGAILKRMIPGLFQGAASNQAFAQGLNGQRQSAIQQLLTYLSPANQQAMLKAQQRGNTEQAAQGARQANLANRSMGLGDGFQAGNTSAAFGQAARMNNDLLREYASPGHHLQTLGAMLQAIAQGQQNPEFQQLQALFNPIEQRHQANQAEMGSGSFLRQAAPIIGTLAGQPNLFGRPQAPAPPKTIGIDSNYGAY